MIAYIYDISETLNNKVNIEKLNLEIRASSVVDFETPPYLYAGKLYINMAVEADTTNKQALDQVISNHDGNVADVSENEVSKRETKIRELTEMAIFHPLLDNVQTVSYLTSVDNWFNAWKRSGVSDVLVSKITSDATDTDNTFYNYLNTVVNPTEGYTAYQFMISIITS